MGQWAMWIAAAGAASAFADDVPAIYAGADLRQGRALIEEHECNTCHAKKVGGDGSAIYKPGGSRVTSLGSLRGMVEACNMQLNLQLFPEDVTSIAAVLNRDHYHYR